MAQIVGLFGSNLRNRLKRDWSNQDIAELYRVEACLVQAGLRIDTERGVADEGDPWFVFCRSDSGEVIAHFARINGQYIIASPALPKTLSGFDLGTIVQQFVAENPVSLPSSDGGRRNNVVFHPAALLTIFVATIFLMASPDESFAAVATNGDETNGDETSVEGSTAATGVAERVLGEDKVQTAEKAFLVIAAALAVEASHTLEQNNLNVLDMAEFDLGGLFLDVKKDTTSHDDLVEIGPLGLSDAYASHDERQGQIGTIVEPEKIEQDASFGSAAHPTYGNVIAFLDDKAQLNASLLLDEAALPNLSSHSGDPAMFNPAETTVASEYPKESPSLQTSTGGEAHIWVEEKVIASGLLSVVDNNQGFAQVGLVVEFIESGKVDGGVVEFESPSLINEITDDQSILNVIENFMVSDEDIVPIDYEKGWIFYDKSDVIDGDMLKMHAWVFDDGTSVAILGHSDTITDLMAGTA